MALQIDNTNMLAIEVAAEILRRYLPVEER